MCVLVDFVEGRYNLKNVKVELLVLPVSGFKIKIVIIRDIYDTIKENLLPLPDHYQTRINLQIKKANFIYPNMFIARENSKTIK